MDHIPQNNEPPDNPDPGSSLRETLSPGLKSWRHNAYTVPAVCGFILLAVALVFGQTLRHEFVNYDDDQYVYENPQVAHGLSAHGIAWAFTARHASNWHPLTWISHMVDSQLYGLHAGGHHLTSVLLHAAAAILLFLALRRMTGALWPSAFVAMVFAIHPLRVESVAWVAERKDVLSGLFFMLTLWAYVGYARRPFSPGRYLTVMGLFFLGLMSKPMLVTLPFVLMLLDYWPLGRLGQREAGKTFSLSDLFPRRVIVEKLPLLALTAASCVATFIAQRDAVVPIVAVPVSSRIANALVSIVAYLGDLFYPVGLAALYPHPGSSLPIWKVVASILALTGISLAALAWRRRFPYLFVGWLWYVGMLVPVIGVVQVGFHSMADRYTYLPQIGLCIALTWGVAQLAASWRYRRHVFAVAAALVVLVLMGFAWRQTSYWRDSETLWTHTVACTARNYIALNNFGNTLAGRGKVDAAIAQYRKALEISADDAGVYNNLASTLANHGQVDAAIAHFQKSLELKPNFAAAHNNLGYALAGRGQGDAAIAHYRKALEISPNFAAAHNNIGNALADRGQVDAAITHFQKALEIEPDFAKAHYNLGNTLAGRGQVDAAMVHFQRALEVKSDYTEAHNNLGVILVGRGQVDAAINHYQRALAIKPDYADAHYNLGLALELQGKIADAVNQWREAARLQPNHMSFLSQLAWTLATCPDGSIRNVAEAIDLARRAVQLSGGQEPAILDTLAVAYAEAGRFSEAADTTKRAASLASARGNTALADMIRSRIKFYRERSRYPETRPQASRVN